MAVTPGSKVYGSEYNGVATLVNKVFGDNYPTATPLTSAEASATTPAFNTSQYANVSRGTDINGAPAVYGNYRFGWGAVNIANNIAVGDLITAERLQYLVDRVNIMVDHINITDTILVFAVPTGRNTVDKYATIRAEDLNVVENKINNSVIPNYNYNSIDPTDASLLIATQTPSDMERTAPWTNKITGEYKWVFDDYNHARHFFNSGGQLRIQLEMSGGCTAGYYNWSDVINEMGVLTFTIDNLYQSNNHYTAGTSYGKGFYHLTENYGDGSDTSTNEGLLFESSGVTVNLSGYGYGYGYGSAYSGYYGFVSNSMSGYTTGYHYCPPSAYSAYATSVYATSYGSYSGYANLRFKIYGKWDASGTELHFKVILDDTAYDQTIDGQISSNFTYLMPDTITRTSWVGSATFDVNPDPYVVITDNFNTMDDS